MDGDFGQTEFREDNDSLYRMPMQIVPVETAELRRGRMIKNAALDPAIERFRNEKSGSGQILISDIDTESGHHMFGWPVDAIHPDLTLLRKLSRLTSFDVYSLRIQFRELGIEPSSIDYLRLSPEKQDELRQYMQVFTRPLLNIVYGSGAETVQARDSSDLINLFRNPDTRAAQENLMKLAKALDVEIMEIPKFLEDFSDIYLSLAYFQEYVDDLTPKVVDMVAELKEVEDNWQLQQDPHVIKTAVKVQAELNELLAWVTGRFEAFHKRSEEMWNELDAERFKEVKDYVVRSHRTVGGVLCGLGIKVNAWKKRFPNSDASGPMARAEMLLSEVLPGLDKLQMILERAVTETDTR